MSNTINWGKIQGLSYSPETNLTGTAAAPSFTNTKSIALDGVDDFVDCGNPTSLQITGELSISAWFKTSSTSAQIIVGKDGETPNRSFLLFYSTASSTIKFAIFQGGSVNITTSTSTVTDGNWHHVLAVNDGTNLKIYIDGSLEDTNVGGGGSIDNTSAEFHIGKKERATGDFFNGVIDEVAVWNSDQSANASTIYNSGVPNDISSLSPLSWWRCGDGDTSPTLTDNGSASNNGTMTNFTTFSTDVPT